MLRLNLTLPTPAENLALDEALLEWAEAENRDWEFLRVWESPRPVVVVGRSTRVDLEVNLEACRAHGIDVKRVLTDNGGAYRSRPFRKACRWLGITTKRTRPYRPQTNGKAERMIQTLLRKWAYAIPYANSLQRRARQSA